MRRKKGINEALEIPKEIYSNIPNIILTGFEDLIIENYKGILEYEEYYIKINTEIGIININGIKLNLEKMTDENLKITGKIESISIERTIDE